MSGMWAVTISTRQPGQALLLMNSHAISLAGELSSPNTNVGVLAMRILPAVEAEAGGESAALNVATIRAHQRLLRIFVHAHVTDGRPLRAFDAWATAEG